MLTGECAKGINLFRCLSGTEWGAHRDSPLLLYKAIIRSHLDYGGLVLGEVHEQSKKNWRLSNLKPSVSV